MFVMFSLAHTAALAGAIILIAAILIGGRHLRKPRANRAARTMLAALLIGCEISLHVWYALTDNWGVHSLPFQLCSMTVWLSAAVMLLGDRGRKLHDIVFFLGLLGALQAMLTPNLDYTFPHFRYFHFFLAHIGIIAVSVYIIAVDRYRPTLRSAGKALLWLHVLAVPGAVANWITGSNFMFLARKPDTASLLDLLAPWPWYLLQLEAIAALLCGLLLAFVLLAERAVGWTKRSG
jgi:hypothetical integral membrane protein (TIGR02206 family)